VSVRLTGILAATIAALSGVGAAGQVAQRTVWDGVFTAGQAKDGAALYQTHCAECHGESLGGVESAPALTGVSFNSKWEGVPLGDLFERMRVSMPPGKVGSIPRPDYADILAFMLQRSGMPAGEAALGGEKAALSGIRFLSYRP
jgi:quinoprotein glucose dehydrogenase